MTKIINPELIRWAKQADEIDLNEVVRFLSEVHCTLSSEEYWTQGSSARDVRGENTMPDSYCASRWCLIGALGKVWLDEDNGFLLKNRAQVVDLLDMQVVERWPECPPTRSGYVSLANFNDTFSYSEVYDLLDDTLKVLETEAKTRRKTNV